MSITDLINELEKIRKEHGDLRVTHYLPNLDIRNYEGPRVREIREKRKRESILHFKNTWEDDKVIEKVLHV